MNGPVVPGGWMALPETRIGRRAERDGEEKRPTEPGWVEGGLVRMPGLPWVRHVAAAF